MNAADRRYWRDRARAVLPSATSRELVRAAHLLRRCYDVPTVTYDAYGSMSAADSKPRTDASMFAGRVGGGVPDFSTVPPAYEARRHDLSPDGVVTRYGMARVQGTTVATSPTTPLGATVGLLSQMLEDLPRNSVGALAIHVARLADVFYQVEPMIGTDVAQKHQTIHAADGVDPMACRVAEGGLTTSSKKQYFAPRGITSTHGDTSALGKVYIRDSEKRGVGVLAAASDDPECIYVGFKLIDRGPKAPRRARQKREDRTIGIVTAHRDDLARKALATAANLNRGDRIIIVCDGRELVLTRGKSDAGTFGLGLIGGDRADGIRTPKAVAAQALKLTA